jgi:hypothetical protein
MAIPETKVQKFERIAERRVNETLRALRLLGNLADRRNYEYSEQQVALIFGALDQEYRAIRSRFKAEAASGSQTFKFK